MSRNFYRRGFRILFSGREISPMNSSSHLGFSPFHLVSSVRSFSKLPSQEKPFVISYLINSCGISPQSAQSVSKSIDFETPNRPDSVLSLLKNDYGFTICHISKLVKKAPQVLLADPLNTLLPKLQFLSSIGVPSSDLPEIVCFNPNLLKCSLINQLVPNYNMLKTLLGSEKEIIHSLRHSYFGYCLHKNTPTNISLLRKLNVSKKYISFLLIFTPEVLSCNGDKFRGIVNKVIKLGVGPCEKVFVCALQVLFSTRDASWEEKMGVYRSWGLSEEEILSAFRKHPYCMRKSVKKITGTMDIIVNKIKMGYQAVDVVNCPSIFSYSLEKRIIPRLLVMRALQLKGLVKANVPLSTAITTPEKRFLSYFVVKFEAEIPELLSVYQGKTSIQELGFDVDSEKHVGG